MIRAMAVEALLLALRALVPVSGLMIVLTVSWCYAAMLAGAAWGLAWVVSQIVQLLSSSC